MPNVYMPLRIASLWGAGGSPVQNIARQLSEQTMVSASSVLVSNFDFLRPDFPAGKSGRLCSPPILMLPGHRMGHDLQAATVAGAAVTLEFAVTWKNRRAIEDCRRQGINFIRQAQARGGQEKIRKLAEKEARSHFLQRFSILLVRENCALL